MSTVCPGCVRPVTSQPVICPHCSAAYHASCRDPVLGCVVPGCKPPVVGLPLEAWTTPWIGARATGLFSVLSGLTLFVQEMTHVNAPFLQGGFVVSLHLLALFVWIGCLQDGAANRVTGRRRGTTGLLWITTTIGLAWLIMMTTWRPRNLLTWPCGAGFLIGVLYGLAGLLNDERISRALLAVLAGAPLLLLMIAL